MANRNVDPSDSDRPDGVVGAVANALELLQLLASGQDIQISGASRKLGVSRSTVHRVLNTLAAYGYVDQDPKTRKYRRGPALAGHGRSAALGDEPRPASPSGRTRPIDELIFEIFRVNDRLIAVGDATVRDFGLTSARWKVLGAVAIAEKPPTVAKIAKNMGLSRQAVQRLTNEMSDDGLVQLQDNPKHRRARVVVLTGPGALAYESALEHWRQEWTTRIEATLSDDEIGKTMRGLRRLRALLESKVQ